MRLHPLAPQGRGRSSLARVLLCAALLGFGLLPLAAQAAGSISLFKSLPDVSDPGNINFFATGGTFRTHNNTDAGTNPACQVGASTTANVNLTSTGTITVLHAYLYYGGSGGTGAPGGLTYGAYNASGILSLNGTSFTPDRTFTVVAPINTGATANFTFFGGFKDVTSIVQSVGVNNKTYSMAGLTVDTGNTVENYCGISAVLASWSLVVIYSDSVDNTNRVINIFDGLESFQGSSITLTPGNFQTPTSGTLNGKFAIVTWEGDPDITAALNGFSETITFNGATLTDAADPTGNQYNSTINTIDALDTHPGVDIDSYDISADLTHGASSATTVYSSGQDAVLLTAQVISTQNAPVSDLGITKVHNGTFGYGDNGTYTLSVINNGPVATSGTTKITDTLPAGETFVSGTGTGWNACTAAAQVVTCTSTAVVANGASFSPITLTVAISGTAGTSLANTATVSVDPADFDNTAGNNSSTDTVSNAGGTLVHPDLSTSTKDVVNTSGGDANPGDTLQYTITLNESNGVDASNVSVTDNLPANLSGFVATSVTVTGSSTTITNSSTNTGGTNGDGLLSISNITVPANGSVTIVFTVQVKAGTANCATISNTGTITYAGGNPTTATVTAPTVIVAQSSCASSGNKILYVYDTQTLTRVVQTTNTAGISVAEGGSTLWTLSPAFKKAFNLTAGTVTVELMSNASGAAGNNRSYTVSILKNGTVLGTSAGTGNFTSTTLTLRTSTVTVAATSFAIGDTLVLRVNNTSSGGTNRTINIAQKTAVNNSDVIFATSTVINVDSVTPYNAVYPAVTTAPVYSPGSTVFICAVISDPFGSADVTSAAISLVDSTGTTQVSAAAMTAKGATDCAGTANAADEAYEYTYVIPAPGTAAVGFWTATVTGNEGTEGTVTHTANGAFDVDLPSLLVAKSVSVTTDPVEGVTRSKSIPGATVQYTVQVQNNGRGPVDSGTLVISDPVPANTALSLPAKPPFTFTDGSTSSGLSVSALDGSITYSNNNGATYVYVPGCTRPCTDTAITNFKITLNGAMNGKTGGTAPSFTITYNAVIQ